MMRLAVVALAVCATLALSTSSLPLGAWIIVALYIIGLFIFGHRSDRESRKLNEKRRDLLRGRSGDLRRD
jgi:hypothetical protein